MNRRLIPAVIAALAMVLGVAACDPNVPPPDVNDTYVREPWAHDATTGPEVSGLDEDALPSCGHDGTRWYVTVANTVIQDCKHVGVIVVRAAGVVLSDVVVSGDRNSVLVLNEANSLLLVERSIIRNDVPVSSTTAPCPASIGYQKYQLVETELSGCADGGKLYNDVTVTDSFIHDLSRWCEPGVPPSTSTCTHNDGFQANNNAPMIDFTMTGSSVYLNSCNSNRLIQAEPNGDSELHLTDNFFYGSNGLYHLGNDFSTSYVVTGEVTGNLFAGSPTAGPFNTTGLYSTSAEADTTALDLTGNYFESADPVPTSGALTEPYTCGPMEWVPPTTTTSTTSTTVPETTTTTVPETTTTTVGG